MNNPPSLISKKMSDGKDNNLSLNPSNNNGKVSKVLGSALKQKV